MRTLAIDTATQSLSIALLADNHLVAETNTNTKIQHSTQLLPLLASLCRNVNWSVDSLDQVVVTRGPGSYTGLRIGVTAAKTIAASLDLPLYSVSSLLALAAESSVKTGDIVIPFINARRQTVFAAAYRYKDETWEEILPASHQKFDQVLAKCQELVGDLNQLRLVSPDTEAFYAAIQDSLGENFCQKQVDTSFIHASQLIHLPLSAEDYDTFVPDYAKQAEAEENWLAAHPDSIGKEESYVERID